MKLHNIVDDIFGSKSKIRILRVMFRYPQREFTEREIAKHIGMSQNTVNLALTDLRKTNIMSYKKIGRANVYTINKNSVLIPYISKIFENERKITKDMIQRIKKATSTYISCILFGSFANKTENFESDLDLLIVVKEKRKVKNGLGRLEEEFLRLYSIPLEIVLLTPRELINKWNLPYMKQVRKNNVVINGKTLEELYGKGYKDRPVNRDLYRNYLKKAHEFYRCMEHSFDTEDWNACVVNAIHCAISSADAMTVFFLGFRHAGEKHLDVLQLLQEIDFDPKDMKSKSRQLSSLLLIKNRAEYEERLMRKSDAVNAKKAAMRFHDWAEENLS